MQAFWRRGPHGARGDGEPQRPVVTAQMTPATGVAEHRGSYHDPIVPHATIPNRAGASSFKADFVACCQTVVQEQKKWLVNYR